MTEVHANLSSNRATQRLLRHRSAVMTLARMRAKKAVLLALRAQGLKPQDFSVREVGVLTDYYVNQHRARLMAEAAEEIATWPEFARWRLPSANINNNAQTENKPKSITSAVQMSGATMIVGSARVSADGQTLDAQQAAVREAGDTLRS